MRGTSARILEKGNLMVIDIANPQELDALMVRVHARRVASINAMLKKPMPPGIAAALAGDTTELMRADNLAYFAWCKARGVECLICGNGEYSEWLGEPLLYAEHPDIARQAAERRGRSQRNKEPANAA